MKSTSEYTIPIFISSTHYNLIDLRAELSHYLGDLGYEPKLSSDDYFHDKSPDLEPWESCLPVLDSCFVMILIIDGKYGYSLDWSNYPEIPKINNKERTKISPTHGEYLFAHNRRKRILVFVRKEMMTHYQSFRKALKNAKNDKKLAKEYLDKTLPSNIDFEALDFLHEVKISRPIPWIKEFEDVTSVKKEVHKKMLNELAEIFLFREKRLETIVDVFNKAVDELSDKQRDEFISKINITSKLREELNQLNEELEKLQKQTDNVTEEKNSKIEILQAKIKELEKYQDYGFLSSSDLLINDDGKIRLNSNAYLDKNIKFENSNLGLISFEPFHINKCDECGKGVTNSQLLAREENLKTCHYCNRKYCNDCWDDSGYISYFGKKCPKCQEK